MITLEPVNKISPVTLRLKSTVLVVSILTTRNVPYTVKSLRNVELKETSKLFKCVDPSTVRSLLKSTNPMTFNNPTTAALPAIAIFLLTVKLPSNTEAFVACNALTCAVPVTVNVL